MTPSMPLLRSVRVEETLLAASGRHLGLDLSAAARAPASISSASLVEVDSTVDTAAFEQDPDEGAFFSLHVDGFPSSRLKPNIKRDI